MNAVRNTGVPESSVPGTTDMLQEKSIDSVIQSFCKLRRNGASERSTEFPRPEMIAPRSLPSRSAVTDWSRTRVKQMQQTSA